MKIKICKTGFTMTAAVCLPSAYSAVNAEEKIIQEEKMSFERCLKVIKTSENKLSIAPKISDVSDQKRMAIFALSDGTLKIICDGEKDIVTVLTQTD